MNQSKGRLRDLSLPGKSGTWSSASRRLGMVVTHDSLINPDPGLIPTQFLGKT